MPLRAGKAARRPSRTRFAILVFLFVYPLVTGLMYLSLAATPFIPVWLRTLHIVPITVAAMVWGVIPVIQRRLSHLL